MGPLPRSRARGGPGTCDATASEGAPDAPDISLEQLNDAWTRSVLPAVKERSIPVATLLSEAAPTDLDGETLTLTFRPGAEFHRKQADEPANAKLLRDALYEVTGRKLAVVTAVGDAADEADVDETPLGEHEVISLLVNDLNATEVEETP